MSDKVFGISYHPNTALNPIGAEITKFMNLFRLDKHDGEETALYDGKLWRILEGDFRSDYEKLVPRGLKTCIAFYDGKKAKYRSNYSTDEP